MSDQEKYYRRRFYKLKHRGCVCEYDDLKLLLINSECCEICDKDLPELKDRYLDHCHDSGKLRGVLCHKCNTSIGLISCHRILNSAVEYLKRHSPREDKILTKFKDWLKVLSMIKINNEIYATAAVFAIGMMIGNLIRPVPYDIIDEDPHSAGLAAEPPTPEPTRWVKTDIKRYDTYTERTLPIGSFNGTRFYVIQNRARSFDSLLEQADKVRECDDENIIAVDWHFNWCSENEDSRSSNDASGPIMLTNKLSGHYGNALLQEFAMIYESKGFVNNRRQKIDSSRQGSLGVLRRGYPVVISEFAFINDRLNPEIVDYIKSEEGCTALAMAILNASSGYDKVILMAGHHRSAGHGPAEVGDFDEIDHSFDVFHAVNKLLRPVTLEVQLTRYGYSGDPYMNDNDRRSIGNRNNKLCDGCSVALSPETAFHLGIDLKAGQKVAARMPDGTVRVFNVDDTTAKGLNNYRLDIFDKSREYADLDGELLPLWKYSEPTPAVEVF